MNRCSICDKAIIGTSWFCNKCAIGYKLTKTKYEKWPEWVRYLVRCERKERHKDKLDQEFGVISYGLLEDLTQESI